MIWFWYKADNQVISLFIVLFRVAVDSFLPQNVPQGYLKYRGKPFKRSQLHVSLHKVMANLLPTSATWLTLSQVRTNSMLGDQWDGVKSLKLRITSTLTIQTNQSCVLFYRQRQIQWITSFICLLGVFLHHPVFSLSLVSHWVSLPPTCPFSLALPLSFFIPSLLEFAGRDSVDKRGACNHSSQANFLIQIKDYKLHSPEGG